VQHRINIARVTKLCISLGFFAFSFTREFVLQLCGRKHKGYCVILYYHSIPADQRDRFASQLDVTLQSAVPVALSGVVTLRSGVRYVGITFDDAFENFAQIALPELAKRKIPSTVFVIADALGKAFGPLGRPERVMSTDQLKDLPADLVTIGSHTLSHPFLPSISEEDARREIAQSRVQIESLLNHSIGLFSFPFGGFNETLIQVCRESGYQRVFTTLPQLAFEGADEYVTGRVRVDPSDWPLEFRLKLAGAYRWLPSAIALKQQVLAHSVMRWILRRKRAGDVSGGRRSIIQESNACDAYLGP
jgi:peptidoglycan/xylan/chitin deacetylase (PgdA/CDA1 family)